MATITNAQMKILEALNRYTFLTVPLIDTLKIHKNKVSIYRSLQALKNRSKPLVYTQNFGVHPTKGQLPSLLYLSKFAKEILLDNGCLEENINIPSNKTFVSTDYMHRVTNIQTYILLDLYMQSLENAHIIFLDYYFSKSSKLENSYMRAKNRIDLDKERYMIPDIITKFEIEDRIYFYLIEIHFGRDANKAFYQCLQHTKAIDLGTPKKKYSHPKNNRVVFIFENEGCMQAVMKKMYSNIDLKKYENLFLFSTTEKMKKDFSSNWFKFNGEITTFI